MARSTSLLALLLLSKTILAAEYYVSPNGDDWNSGTSASEPWRSIAKANGKVRAGDTVYLRGGEYIDDPIDPQSSGQSGAPILYSAYQGEQPVITSNKILGLKAAIRIDGVSHIVVQKIFVSGRQPSPQATLEHFVTLQDASYVEIRDCEFEYAEGWEGIGVLGNSHHNKIVRNRVDFVGAYDKNGDDYGDSIWFAAQAYSNLLASNFVTHGGHNLLNIEGSGNVIQDNVFDNGWSDVLSSGLGGRNLSLSGERNVFQRNIVRNASVSIDSMRNSGMKVEGKSNIVRHNLLLDNHHDAFQTETGYWQEYAQNNLIYHNTIYNNGGAAWRIRFYDSRYAPTGNVFKNNLVYQNRQDPPKDAEDADFRIILDDSGLDAPGDNAIVNNLVMKATPGDARIYMTPPYALVELDSAELTTSMISSNIQERPLFVSQQPRILRDFELVPGSPGHDEAAPLTTASSTGFGSSVRVKDASYFSDGQGVGPGDVLRVGSEQDVRVLEVDYGSNTLVVDREIGWVDGDAVSLEFKGAAPDIGAVEAGQVEQSAQRPKAPLLIATPILN